MSLEGKTVLITGAAKRIGRSLALAVARAGGDVVVHYGGSEQEAESLAVEIQALGRSARMIQADLSDPGQVASVVPRALESGPLFAMVNNASIFEPLNWKDTTLESWNRHLMVNLTAPFLLSQSFANHLPAKEVGRIVNLLDWRAMRPGVDHLPYTISKAALAALTRSLAQALAPQINVNGLALGAILPPSDGGAADRLVDSIPARRWARMEEVEQSLLFFLTGPEYVTGEILHIDGGRHLV
jgi:NAD(P)-dependent dehydrogenase (short-subunit alcohol dehydrogenase family)